MAQQLNSLLEQLHGLWRFRWIGVAVAWVVLLAGLLVITLLPDRYQASAAVFVDTQTALSAATRNLTVDQSTDSQIQRVREALLGGPQLTKIADDLGLTARSQTPQERQKILDRLRGQIQIADTMAGEAAQGAATYIISYSNKDRETSLKVVNRFVNSFVQDAQLGKQEGYVQTQKFLTQQIAELEKRLRDAEEALATFKKENVGLLPGNQNDYFSRLDTDSADLGTAQTKLAVATMRRNELRRQLNGEQPLIADGAQHTASPSTGAASDTTTRLEQSQRQLDELLLNYTDKHPKVIELRNTIAALKKRLADEIEAARHGDVSAAASTGLAASPVYQNLQIQYDQVGVEIAGLQADIADRRERVAALRSMINTAPEVEAQFSRLNRDYSVVKAQYEALVDQLGRARLSEQAAQTGVIRFDVVDPPRAGFDPIFPKRPLLAVGVLVASIGAGAGVVFLLSILRPVFVSVRRLQEITGLEVLGVVSMTWIERYNSQRRRSALGVAGAILSMVLVCGVYLATQRHLASNVRTWMDVDGLKTWVS